MADLVASIFGNLKDTNAPILLIVIGAVFLLLAFVGRFNAHIAVPPNRQLLAGIVGGVLLLVGILLPAIPIDRADASADRKSQVALESGNALQQAEEPRGSETSTLASGMSELTDGELLTKALEVVKTGQCPPSLFHSVLENECIKQLDMLTAMLQQSGSIKNVMFKRMQASGAGQAQVYQVDFENRTMEWYINRAPDGRLMTLWAPSW